MRTSLFQVHHSLIMKHKLTLLFVTLAFVSTTMSAQKKSIPENWITLAEQTDFRKTPKYDETMDFFKRLSDLSPMVHFEKFGKTAQGRDLDIVILDKDGLTDPGQIRAKGRVLILVQSCIHSGEPDGKDACMIFLRDLILTGKDQSLLDDVSFVMIPIFNADGHEDFRATNRINQNGPEELGTRNTAQLLNLNRDFVKCDTPEMKAWMKLYNRWDPELFIDCHVTNGADFQYVMTYSIENRTNAIAEPLRSFCQDVYEKDLNKRMTNVGFPMFTYCDYNRTYAPEMGAIMDVFDPRYSESYVAYRNRLGLLLETHIYKPYKERVMATLESIRQSAYILQANKSELVKAIREADRTTASEEFRKKPFALSYTIDEDKIDIVDYLGWERDTIKSDLSGGEWVRHNYDKPMTYHIPLRQIPVPDVEIRLPKAYIIMPQYSHLTDLLDCHNLKYSVLEEAKELEVETYRYTGAKYATYQSEGRIPVLEAPHTTQTEKILCPKGSIIVDMNQPSAKLAAFMFEPDAPGSLIYWGFFNVHLQPGSEFFVRQNYMEVKGREMIENEPDIRKQYEEKMKDPEFANNPSAILDFFYQICLKRANQNADVHPILRLMD